MKKLKQAKGITLIALIITIIVLLILAVVSISLVMNDGIISKAEKGVQEYSNAEQDEQEQLLQAEYEMAKYEGKFSGTYEDYVLEKQYGVKIGDYVNYDPTKDAQGNAVAVQSYTSYSKTNASADKNEGRSSGWGEDQVFNLSSYTGGWRVLGIENGQLQLISADIIGPDSGGITEGTNKYYVLDGEEGYIDGIGELDAISSMYGQGAHATGAKSINVDDINKITGYDPTTYSGYEDKWTYKYPTDADVSASTTGLTKNMWYKREKSDGTLVKDWTDITSKSWQKFRLPGESETIGKISDNEIKEGSKEVTSTNYSYYPTTLTTSSSGEVKGIEKTSDAWQLLFKNTSSKYYWLASPYVGAGSSYAYFGLRSVAVEGVRTYLVTYSFTNSNDGSKDGVRPVVSLESDIQIDKTVGNGSAANTAYGIK